MACVLSQQETCFGDLRPSIKVADTTVIGKAPLARSGLVLARQKR